MLTKNTIANLLSWMLLLVSTNALAHVDDWLDKVSEAYGGMSQIEKVQSYRQYGVTYSSMRKREGKLFRAYRHPDHLRIEIDYGPGDTELRLLAGPRSWKQNKPVAEPFYSAMLLQASRLGLPAVLFPFRKFVRDVGTFEGLEGKHLQWLELSFHNNRLLVGIDPDSGRIMESRGKIKTQQVEINFSTAYADFRKVNGRLFAFKETHYVMGRKMGHTHLDKIVVEPLDEELFRPVPSQPTPSTTIAGIWQSYQR